ncbi:MAG: flagellar hook-associated protein FlgL [Burkholderiales bacterium]|jgi:flagellar hook-associated protein 3 FlgL|nr:flagellar hook-associated protein FlgL [Burkholderiales bacterium]
MRISTTMFFGKNIDTVLRQQSEILKLQGQMSNGVRVDKSSDDPFAKSTFLSSNEALAMTNQYQRNIDYALGRGQIIDTSMGTMTDLMANVKERMIQAATATATAADRKNIAQELRVNLQQMLNTANVRDETGRYVFSGIMDDQPAFAASGTPLSTNPADVNEFYKFTGDDRTSEIQISREIKLSLDLPGSEILTLNDGTPATSYFSLLQQSINILEGNAPGSAKGALDSQGAQMDQIFDQMLIGRTRIGAKMRQVDETQLANLSLATEFEITGGRAVGVDFTKAVSDIARLQLSLEASQKTYSQFSKLSIFNFL